jgi:hypothetical protein
MPRPARLFTATVVTLGLTATVLAGVATAGEELSKKAFLEEANTTCKGAWEAVDAAFEEQFAGLGEDGQPSPEQIEAGVAAMVEILREMAEAIEPLRGPAALEKKVDKFLDRFDAVVDEFEADPQTAFDEELSGYPFAKPDKQARKIGLKKCAQRK